MNKLKSTLSILTLAGLLAAAACSDKEANDQSGGEGTAKTVTLLNVSYDPTRELYKEVNAGFASKWEADTGQKLRFNMSHGGSGKQSRARSEEHTSELQSLMRISYAVFCLKK